MNRGVGACATGDACSSEARDATIPLGIRLVTVFFLFRFICRNTELHHGTFREGTELAFPFRIKTNKSVPITVLVIKGGNWISFCIYHICINISSIYIGDAIQFTKQASNSLCQDVLHSKVLLDESFFDNSRQFNHTI